MAENRYSVDDILRELNLEKKERTTQPTTSSLYDNWGFDSQDRKDSPRSTVTQERPRISQSPNQRNAVPRTAPHRGSGNPRLGQTMTLPTDREERERILQKFDTQPEETTADSYDFPDAAYARATSANGNGASDWSRATATGKPRPAPRQPQRVSTPPSDFYGGSNENPPREQNGRSAASYTQHTRHAVPNANRVDQRMPPRQDQLYGRYSEQPFHERPPISRRPLPPTEQVGVQQMGFDAPPPRPLRNPQPTEHQGHRYPRRDSVTGEYSVAKRKSMANAARMLTGGLDSLDDDMDGKVSSTSVQEIPPPPIPSPISHPQQPVTNKNRSTAVKRMHLQQTQSFSPPEPDDLNFFGETPPEPNNLNNVSTPQFAGSQTQNFSATITKDEDSYTTTNMDSHDSIFEDLRRMRVGLIIRIITNIFAVAAVIYLSLAGEYSLPLPSILSENTGFLLWTELGILIVSALISGNTIGGGILSLLKLKPSNDSYTALAVFASLLQGGYMALQPQLIPTYGSTIYLPLAALLLLFNSLGKVVMLSRIEGSFSIVSKAGNKTVVEVLNNRELSKRLACDLLSGEIQIGYAAKATQLNEFLDEAFSESKTEDISKIIAPMTALAALLMALLSYLFTRDIFSSACVYTGALCITAPLASVIASNLPLSITNGKLARFGATICGYHTVNKLADTNEVILTSTDLFPKGSVRIKDIKILDRRPIDQVVLDASSVLSACNNSLTDIFKAMIPDSSILPYPESLEYLDNMGMSAWVNGRRVLIGNRQLMQNYGIQLPDFTVENQYKNDNDEVLYLSNSGIAAAMYIISYKADKKMRRTLELLCDSDIAVCINSTDPNVTKERIGRLYDFPTELITIVPGPLQPEVKANAVDKEFTKATAVCSDSTASALRCILAAKSCSRCITIETALILMSVVIGFAIVTFFAFTKQMASLTWVTIAVYQFFWLLIELIIPLTKH